MLEFDLFVMGVYRAYAVLVYVCDMMLSSLGFHVL